MARKRRKAEEIATKLRQVDVPTAQGHLVAEAIRSIGVTAVLRITGGGRGRPPLGDPV
jgi:hypothetical protein